MKRARRVPWAPDPIIIRRMAYIICEPCVGTKDTACVDVCPVDCIHPRKDEPTFAKSVGDAFSNAALAAWVAELGAGEVILLGAQTDACVAATVTGALAAGLEVTVVSDAHGTWDFGGETADEIIARHNAAFAAAGAKLVTTRSLTGAVHA